MVQEFDFEKIMKDMQKAFKLTDKEVKAYANSPAFKILAYMPYIAKCKDADRCSYVNLSSAILASRLGGDSVAVFREEDLASVSKRLDYLFHFIGGNKKILKKGKALLKYNMLLDYKKDYEKDTRSRKNNPIFYDTFNVEKEINVAKKEVGTAVMYDDLFEKTAVETVSEFSFWMMD